MVNSAPRPNLRIQASDDLRVDRRCDVNVGALQDLIQLDRGVVMGGFALDISGFRLESGTMPDRVNWQVYASSYCQVDDEPLCSGTTFLKGVAGAKRQGLLFEVRRQAVTYLIRGYAASDAGAAGEVSFACSFIVFPQDTSFPPVIAGTLIG